MENDINKEVTIDIKANKYDIFTIFITLGSFYVEEFYNIINVYHKKLCKKKDYNDIILEELDYIFS
jgi:hypothetical protein